MTRLKLMRRRSLILGGMAGGAAGLAALAGCGQAKVAEVTQEAPLQKAANAVTQGAATAAPKQVTLEVNFPASKPDGGGLMTKTVIPRFKSQYPHVTVKYAGSAWSENQKKLMERIAAGKTPDVFLHDDVVLPSLAAQGSVLSLDEYWKRDGALVSSVVGEAASVDKRSGQRYGLARNALSTAMLYNRELFEKSGVEAPGNDSPWNWQEWVQIMRKLTWDKQNRSPSDSNFDPENVVQWGYWSRPDNMAVEWAPLIFQSGGAMLDETTRKSTINNGFVIDALTFMNDMVWYRHVAPTPEQVASAGKDYHVMFLSGRCASTSILLGEESGYPPPDKAKFEIKAMVQLHSKLKGVEHGSVRGASTLHHQMMIAKGSKAPDEAWAFMVFQATDEASSTGIYTTAHYGLPPDKRYWTSPAIQQRDIYPKEMNVFFDPFEKGYGHGLWPNLAWSEWRRAIQTSFDEFIHNRIPVKEGVKRAQLDSQAVLDAAYAKLGA